MPAVSRASYSTYGSSRTTAIAAPSGIEAPLSQTTALLPQRAQPKATIASATSTTMGPVPVTTCTPPVSQAIASAAPGAWRESETATATPTTTRTSPDRLVTTRSSCISQSPSTSTSTPTSASGRHGRERCQASGSVVMRVIEPCAVPCAESPARSSHQLAEEVGVRQSGGREHPRHLGVLGHPRDRVHLVEHRTVLGEEEVHPGDAGAA